MGDWNHGIQRAIGHSIRRRIVESLRERDLSFSELLGAVGESNHGGFGFHLRKLKEFVEFEPSTKKYHLTERGKLLAHVIRDFRSMSSRERIFREYVESLTSGDHALVLYTEENFKRRTLLPFVKAGLLKGEAVVYLVSERKLGTETREIQRCMLDFEDLPKEAFTITSADKWYMKKGKAQPETIVANWVALVEEKQEAGFSGVRAAGETGVFFDYGKVRELLKYEELLGRQFSIGLCALCLYEQNRLDQNQLKRVLNCHGHLISKGILGKTTL